MNFTRPLIANLGTRPFLPLAATAVTIVLVLASLSALGQTPVIRSFAGNGELVCTNLLPGRVATVEWAPTVNGPWTRRQLELIPGEG